MYFNFPERPKRDMLRAKVQYQRFNKPELGVKLLYSVSFPLASMRQAQRVFASLYGVVKRVVSGERTTRM